MLAPVAHLLHLSIAQSVAALQNAGVPDTLLMRQVSGDQSWIDRVAALASIVISVALAVLALVAIPIAIRARRVYQKASHLLERVYGEVTPITDHLRQITDNVNYVTTSVRADIQAVRGTIHEANTRAQDALTRTERRMNELNALLKLMQQEAEQIFVSTASTVRGVRHGAAAFRDQQEQDAAFDEYNEHDQYDEHDEHDEHDKYDEYDEAESADDIELQEELDGHDRKPQSSTQAFVAAPRVRPRQRRK